MDKFKELLQDMIKTSKDAVTTINILNGEIKRLERELAHERAAYKELACHHDEHCTCMEIY